MLIIPLKPVPSQQVSVTLANQPCLLMVYQKTTGLYMDVYVNDVLIIGGVIALDAVRIVRSAYLGFIGDFAFYDTQGTAAPQYPGLGSQWVLAYLEVADL